MGHLSKKVLERTHLGFELVVSDFGVDLRKQGFTLGGCCQKVGLML